MAVAVEVADQDGVGKGPGTHSVLAARGERPVAGTHQDVDGAAVVGSGREVEVAVMVEVGEREPPGVHARLVGAGGPEGPVPVSEPDDDGSGLVLRGECDVEVAVAIDVAEN